MKQFFEGKIEEKSVMYATATVLLDMTANERCIEHIALLLRKHDMFPFVVAKLHELMDRKPKDP